MKLQAYNAKYHADILAVWNRSMVADPLSEARFLHNVVLDQNFNPDYCQVAIIDNQVAGFIWSVVRRYPYGERGLESERGWIVAVCVAPEFQRRGVGKTLVRYVEQLMKLQRVQKITLGAYSPNYLFPGIDVNTYAAAIPFFEKLGYEQSGEAVSMERSLFDYRQTDEYLVLKQKALAAGFAVQPFSRDYAEELIDFLHKYFGGGWSTNARNAMLKGVAEETIFIVTDNDDKIVGYAQRAIDGNPDRFGPFGVREDLRGYKLGMILFNEILFDMQKRGIYHTYFLWTHGAAQKFYERNGMQVYREYILMNKKL